jgi:Ca-activated chloride channel family protein
MRTRKKSVLALGMVVVLVVMAFATVPMGTIADDPVPLPPTITKTASPTDICFGSINTKSTVTITVTGDGGTSTTITPMDVVFAIDSSGSMTITDPSDGRLDAAKYFVDQMDDSRDTGGVVSWDNDIDFTYDLSDDFDDTDGLKYEIDQVDSSGGTNLNVGLDEAIDMLDANTRTEESAEVIIFLTDGIGTYTDAADGGPASEAATSGYTIYSIGLSSYVDEEPLEDMADATGGSYYFSATSSNLQDIYDDIFDEIVTSTIPHYVDVVEITESYITGHSDFNIAPTSISTSLSGQTTIIWEDVAKHVGNYDDALTADETVTLTFKVGANKPGYHMGIQVLPGAKVLYSNVDGIYTYWVPIPQAYINVKQTANLIADGGDEYLDVGDVIIWQDATNVYVKYVTTDGWYMTETHLHVDDALADIPKTNKGNPKIGKFDYSTDHSPAVQEYTYTIPWVVSSGDTLYFAVHAVVQKEIPTVIECTEPEYRIETAWGEGDDFGGNSWAMYIEYVDP